jgi:hypothetical protein
VEGDRARECAVLLRCMFPIDLLWWRNNEEKAEEKKELEVEEEGGESGEREMYEDEVKGEKSRRKN